MPSCVNQDPGIFSHEDQAGDKPWVHWRCPRPHHGPRGGHRSEQTVDGPRKLIVEPACNATLPRGMRLSSRSRACFWARPLLWWRQSRTPPSPTNLATPTHPAPARTARGPRFACPDSLAACCQSHCQRHPFCTVHTTPTLLSLISVRHAAHRDSTRSGRRASRSYISKKAQWAVRAGA